jgi:hypothetical protein
MVRTREGKRQRKQEKRQALQARRMRPYTLQEARAKAEAERRLSFDRIMRWKDAEMTYRYALDHTMYIVPAMKNDVIEHLNYLRKKRDGYWECMSPAERAEATKEK